MATRYSDLYASTASRAFSGGAETTTYSYSYKGPYPTKVGEHVTIRASYNLAGQGVLSSAHTTLNIADVPAGFKLIRLTISSGDDDVDSDNDFTFDLGFTAALTGFLSASTVLQAGAETVYVSEDLEEIAAATVDGALILTRAAGTTNTSGTIYFLVEGLITGA